MQHTEHTKAILIDVIHPKQGEQDSLKRLQELEELVNTYGGIVVVKTYQRRFSPHPRTYIGTGKAEQLGEEGKDLGASLVIVNGLLKPRQLYLLGEMLRPYKMQIWDRVDLILKIFAKHAKTTEAKLEIELASIRHMGPRIFGMGMELSRQGGGIGTSGVGETNTEIMKRHLREKEQKIRKKLDHYKKVRAGHRKHRRRQSLKTLALVGYTNAGKTTLLNRLTGRKEYAANELFATLDTRVGQLYLPNLQRSVLISDTIGFIQNLPPELLNAFSSTLSEAVEANMLLHVVDVSHPDAMEHIRVVEDILERLEADDIPVILILNKTDAAKKSQIKKVTDYAKGREYRSFTASAKTGDGIPELIEEIEKRL